MDNSVFSMFVEVPKPSKVRSLVSVKEAFIKNARQALEAIETARKGEVPPLAKQAGWVIIYPSENTLGEYQFFIRPGYGQRNEFIPDNGGAITESRMAITGNATEAITLINDLIKVAEAGGFDAGLLAYLKKRQAITAKKKATEAGKSQSLAAA